MKCFNPIQDHYLFYLKLSTLAGKNTTMNQTVTDQKVRTYKCVLFCTEVQVNGLMFVRVQLLLYSFSLSPPPLNKLDHIFSPLKVSPNIVPADCRCTQFRVSINKFVSQRGSRQASCIVDVVWLKSCVQSVIIRNEDLFI